MRVQHRGWGQRHGAGIWGEQQLLLQDTMPHRPACSQGGKLYMQEQQQHSQHAGESVRGSCCSGRITGGSNVGGTMFAADVCCSSVVYDV